MDLKIIEETGLTPSEAKIYMMLLKAGSSLAGNISRQTGIHRRSVYDCIERLMEKGLVSSIKTNNRQYFEAAPPQRLMEIIRERESSIQSLLPELESLYQSGEEKKDTLFFRGKQGIKNIFDDQIKERKEILIFGATLQAADIMKYYFPHYDKQRKQKAINVKIIFDESARGSPYLENIPLCEIRYLPRNYATPAATNIYGGKVAIILWSESPIGILIKEEGIALSYRKYFELMWGIAKQ